MSKKTVKQKVKNYIGNMLGLQTTFYSGSTIIEEPFTGAWQRNIEGRVDDASGNFAYFSCVTMTANDIGKLDIDVKLRQKTLVWSIDISLKYRWLRDLLEHPNGHQNSQDFFSRWVYSLQNKGNAYVFVERNERDVPVGLYILNPDLVRPLVTENGDVFYKCESDKIIGLKKSHIFSQREIIHHRINAMFHDLEGIPPLHAAAIHVYNSIEQNKTAYEFYKNAARPSGLLIAPNDINEEDLIELKNNMQESMTGRANAGKIFVMSGGVEYQQLTITPQDQQLIEQMKFNAEAICGCFHVPSYMVIGNPPSYNNIEALSQDYFQKALQFIILGIEKNLYRGLELNFLDDDIWPEFNLKNLLRMDQATRFKVNGQAIKDGWMTPNEARAEEDMEPIEGGDTILVQLQDVNIADVAKPDNTIEETANKKLNESLQTVKELKEEMEKLKNKVEDIPGMEYKGVFEDGLEYSKGDCVTKKGSLWICKQKTSTWNPENWQLCVKSGRDGKDLTSKKEHKKEVLEENKEEQDKG